MDVRRPKYQIVDGYRLPLYFCPNAFRSSLQYRPHPGDLFVCTYPKCGTTWMQQIVRLILHSGDSFSNCLHFHMASPCIELYGSDAAENMDRPNAIKTHLPFYKTPYSDSAKYIFMARNPKDCCVSFYYHTRYFPIYYFEDGDFDVFFELFINGETDFGDYFDHLLSWYNQMSSPNVFFLTFEDLKRNTEENVLKISKFIGKEHYDKIRRDPNLLNTILRKSGFEYMKENGHIFYSNVNQAFVDAYLSGMRLPSGIEEFSKKLIAAKVPLHRAQGSFIRKGETGDWKHLFTKEQEERLQEKMEATTSGTEIQKLWT